MTLLADLLMHTLIWSMVCIAVSALACWVFGRL
jgi:hypothetical protein